MARHIAVPLENTLHVRHCLCLATQRAARGVARRFDDAFRPLGITSGQFSLLMSLNRDVPPSMGAAAAFLAMDRTTLTANVKLLAKRRLVAIGIDPDDRRGRLLKLTPAGVALLKAAMPIWERTHKEAEQTLKTTNANNLRAGLRALA